VEKTDLRDTECSPSPTPSDYFLLNKINHNRTNSTSAAVFLNQLILLKFELSVHCIHYTTLGDSMAKAFDV